MTPQFTYDNKGNAVGVFLSIEDWNQIKKDLPTMGELPQWQKDIHDQRLALIKQNPGTIMPLEDFIAEMENESGEEV